MLPRNHPDRIQITFDDRPLGGQCRAAPSGHPGAAPRPARTRPAAPRPGRCPGAGEHERQDDDAGGVCAGWGQLHRRRRCVAHRGDGLHPGRHGQGAIHPGHLPAQLPVGPRPSTRPGEPRVAGPGLAGRAGPGDGPLTIDLDSTICETYGLAKEGARHHGYTGKRGYHPLLAIAAGTGDVLMSRLREGRANTARGAAHFLRETVGRVRYAGGQRGRLTHTGRQRVLHSWRGIRLPQDGCPASPSPSASTKACTISSRRYPKMPGRRFLTGWTVPPMWPRPPAPPSRPRRTPRRYGSSSGG